MNQIFKDLGMLVHEQGDMIGELILSFLLLSQPHAIIMKTDAKSHVEYMNRF